MVRTVANGDRDDNDSILMITLLVCRLACSCHRFDYRSKSKKTRWHSIYLAFDKGYRFTPLNLNRKIVIASESRLWRLNVLI